MNFASDIASEINFQNIKPIHHVLHSLKGAQDNPAISAVFFYVSSIMDLTIYIGTTFQDK